MSIKLVGIAVAAAIVGATPALAQDGMQSGTGMNGSGGAMSSTPMAGSGMSGKMSKSQMASMKRCQAMSSDMMMKNKKCASMAKMHPEMMQGGSTTGM